LAVAAGACFAALTLGTAAFAQDTVTITLMGHGSSPAEDEALAASIAAFEEAYPNIDVDVQLVPDFDTVLQTAFASGDYPEVFYTGQSVFRQYADAGVIANGAANIEEPEGFYPALANVYSLGGELYCPPKDFSNLALEYNKDYFDAAGLEYPNADWTWDDLRAAAEALAASGVLPEDAVPIALNPDIDRWFAFYVQAGGTFYDEDGNFVFASEGANREAAEAAIDFTAALTQDGLAASSSDLSTGWPGEAFGQGKAAMTFEGNWIVGYLNDTFPELNWGTTTLPAGPGGEGTLTFSEAYCVAADNDHPEESWLLVNFLTNEAGAERVATGGFGPMPSRTAASATWIEMVGENGQAFVDGSEFAVAPVTPAGYGDFRTVLGNGLGDAFRGDADAIDVLDETAEAAADAAAG
jgi:multiple sugar transport system substrate-binding protein